VPFLDVRDHRHGPRTLRPPPDGFRPSVRNPVEALRTREAARGSSTRAGRIAALCDVFDALLTERPYKAAWTVDEALGYIESERGRHFDPALTDTFLAMVRAQTPAFEASFVPAHAGGDRIGVDGRPRPPAAGRRRP
jgi:hypothetical protein